MGNDWPQRFRSSGPRRRGATADAVRPVKSGGAKGKTSSRSAAPGEAGRGRTQERKWLMVQFEPNSGSGARIEHEYFCYFVLFYSMRYFLATCVRRLALQLLNVKESAPVGKFENSKTHRHFFDCGLK
jgi:hypothetical protein